MMLVWPISNSLLTSQVFSESANHSGLDPSSTAEVVGSEEAMKMGAVYADIGEGGELSSALYYRGL